MPLEKRLKTIRFYRDLAADYEYKNMRELAFDVLERTSWEKRKRLHAKGAPSFQEILVWATREAKSMDLEQRRSGSTSAVEGYREVKWRTTKINGGKGRGRNADWGGRCVPEGRA